MEKITKRRFIAIINERLAKRTSASPVSATEMYDIFMDTLTDELLKGNSIILTGFGNFDLKPHRGHRIGFENKSDTPIEDYLVVKFAASNVFNRRLRHSAPELFDEIMARENADNDTHQNDN